MQEYVCTPFQQGNKQKGVITTEDKERLVEGLVKAAVCEQRGISANTNPICLRDNCFPYEDIALHESRASHRAPRVFQQALPSP